MLVGNLFLPKDFDSKKRYPAVLSIIQPEVSRSSQGAVKEQSAGLYAYRLAEQRSAPQ